MANLTTRVNMRNPSHSAEAPRRPRDGCPAGGVALFNYIMYHDEYQMINDELYGKLGADMFKESPPHINHKDLNTQVYEILVDKLVTRELAPKQTITISTIADELGVSRSPVHQALTRLASENLIDLIPRKGYFVRPITSEGVSKAFDVRMALELMAAERSVGRVSPAQLAKLRELMEQTLPMIEDDRIINKRGYVRANQAMHLFQVGLADNEMLSMFYNQLSMHLVMGRIARLRDSGMHHIIDEHQELVAAYESGSLERTMSVIRTHINSGRRVAEEEIEAAGGML